MRANIQVDSIKKPRFRNSLDAYRQVWRETFDPTKGVGWNSLARVKNYYRVSARYPFWIHTSPCSFETKALHS